MSLGELARRLDKAGDWSRTLEAAIRRVHHGKNVRASTGIRVLELLEARGMLPVLSREERALIKERIKGLAR